MNFPIEPAETRTATKPLESSSTINENDEVQNPECVVFGYQQQETLPLSYVFNRCGNVKAERLNIDAYLGGSVHITFEDADGEVHFRIICFGKNSALRSAIRNKWDDGKGKSGFFSLLHHAEELEIYNNSQVLKDLLDYEEGRYQVDEPWKREALCNSVELYIEHTDEDIYTIERLREYFRIIIITSLKPHNVINIDCERYIYTGCEEIQSESLFVNAKLSSPQQLLNFNNTNGAVRIPYVIIGPRGNFSSITCNQWWNSKAGKESMSGQFSIFSTVETLAIKENQEAVYDLAKYAVTYNQKCTVNAEPLNNKIQIKIEASKVDFCAMVLIERYFGNVTVNGRPVTEYLTTVEQAIRSCFEQQGNLKCGELQHLLNAKELEEWICIGDSGQVYHIANCGRRINGFIIKQRIEKEQLICFHNCAMPLSAAKIEIAESGNLRTVLQNGWYDDNRSGFFSLLFATKTLRVSNNVEALQDILAYAEGSYELHERWQRHNLCKSTIIEVTPCTEASISIVRKLKEYFTTVRVQELRMDLNVNNAIVDDCDECIFTNCEVVQPECITIDAKINNEEPFEFTDTECQVCIPHITIGPRGELRSITSNYEPTVYGPGEEINRYYNLISGAKTLTIRDNPQAIKDLLNRAKNHQNNNNEEHRPEHAGFSFKFVSAEHPNLVEQRSAMKVIIERCTSNDLRFVKELTNYFATVETKTLELSLTANNTIVNNCLSCTFTNCRAVQPESLTVDAKIQSTQVPLSFHNSDGEVHIPSVTIGPQGEFDSIVRNYWENDIKGDKHVGGYYSILPHVKMLHIKNNLDAVVSLADYVDGKYEPARPWMWEKLSRDIQITIEPPTNDVAAIAVISRYFSNGSVSIETSGFVIGTAFGDPFAKPMRTLGSENTDLSSANWITKDCEAYTFTNCRAVEPQVLAFNAVIENDMVGFSGADGEAYVPHIIIGPRGKFSYVVHNQWNSGGGNGRQNNSYSILQCAGVLTIRDNPGALRDLAAYVDGRYKLQEGWTWRGLNQNTEVRIESVWGSLTMVVAIAALASHHKRITIDEEPVAEYLAAANETLCRCIGPQVEPLEYSAEASQHTCFGGDRPVYHVVKYGSEIQSLTIKQELQADEVICFHSKSSININHVIIEESGNLRNILQNAMFDGEKGSFFSLLYTIKQLSVDGCETLRDLLAYMEGEYELDGRWGRRGSVKNLAVMVRCAEEDIPIVQRLREHFAVVAVEELRLRLGTKTVISTDCWRCVLTDHKGVQPQSLVVDAILRGPGTLLRFPGSNQTHVPSITIGPRGTLDSIVLNACDDTQQGGCCYSLIEHVTELVVVDNSGALRELADYAEGRYNPEGVQCPRPPANVTVHVQRATVADAPLVKRLRARFAVVTIDGAVVRLGAHNAIPASYVRCIFTDCRDAQALSLAVDATPGSLLVEFLDADGEVHIPELVIGPSGDLGAVVWNRWDNGKAGAEHADGHYSLLAHTRVLTIRDNPQAVADLVRATAGEYVQNGPWHPDAPARDTWVRAEHVGTEQTEALVRYFGAMTVDGEVLYDNLWCLCECLDHREAHLRSLRKATAAERQRLADMVKLTDNRVEDARRRLQEARRRFDALRAVAQ